MPRASRQLKFKGRLYRRADTLGDAGLAAFNTLINVWLDDGYRDLIKANFAHLPVDRLAEKMAEKFGVYVGGLAEEYVPWERYAQHFKGEKG